MITSSYTNRECYEEDKTIYNSLLINCRGGGVFFLNTVILTVRRFGVWIFNDF